MLTEPVPPLELMHDHKQEERYELLDDPACSAIT